MPCACSWKYPNTAGGGATAGWLTFGQGLSDVDVERIAKRVVELLKEQTAVRVPEDTK